MEKYYEKKKNNAANSRNSNMYKMATSQIKYKRSKRNKSVLNPMEAQIKHYTQLIKNNGEYAQDDFKRIKNIITNQQIGESCYNPRSLRDSKRKFSRKMRLTLDKFDYKDDEFN